MRIVVSCSFNLLAATNQSAVSRPVSMSVKVFYFFNVNRDLKQDTHARFKFLTATSYQNPNLCL